VKGGGVVEVVVVVLPGTTGSVSNVVSVSPLYFVLSSLVVIEPFDESSLLGVIITTLLLLTNSLFSVTKVSNSVLKLS